VCYEIEDELKRITRNLALLRQSADERIAYWAQWHDEQRQLDLFRPTVDEPTD
jgi:hypothetical protein